MAPRTTKARPVLTVKVATYLKRLVRETATVPDGETVAVEVGALRNVVAALIEQGKD